MKKNIQMLLAVLVLGAGAAHATLEFVASGTSAKGVDVTFEADLTLSGDTLTIILTNNSPVDSLNPDDVMGSFYFDIVNDDGDRPALTYAGATGDTYKGDKNGPDTMIQADADLRALVSNDDSWQFKSFDAAFIPYLGFGIGTVGNSNLSPNGFDGNVVGGVNFAIYKGEITTQSLENPDVLVKDTATFTFTGVTGFTEADISPDFAFGLGTAPDSLLTPEPATMILLAIGGLLLRKHR